VPLGQSTIDTLIDFENDEGFLDRAGSYARQGIANLNSGPSRVRAALNEFDANNPLPWTSAENIDRSEAIADAARRAARQEEIIAGRPIAGKVGLEEIVANPLDLTQYPEGLVNLAANSLPYMVGAKYAPALTTAALSGSLGQQRAENNNRQDATLQDIALAAPAAAVSMAAERLGIEGILGAAGANAATRVAKAGIGEGLSEVGSSSAEYAGGSLGTERGYSPTEAARQAAYGFLGGSFLGSGLRGVYEVGAKVAGVSQNEPPPSPSEPPAPAAGRPAAPPPPPPAPAPADLAQKLGEVGSKIILNEPGGANEYIYRGMDEGGRIIIEAEDGSMFAEDPAEISEAIDIGAAVPTEPFVPGVAIGEEEVTPATDFEDEVEAELNRRKADIRARIEADEELGLKAEPEGKPLPRFTAEVEEPAGKPISSFAPAPMTIQTLPQQLLMAAREQPGGLIPAGSISQPEVMALEEAGIPKNESGDYEAYALIDEADRRYKIGEIDNSMSQYDNSHISGLQQRYGLEPAPVPAAPAESIAPLERMAIDEDVGPYMQEYATFRTADQMRQIEDNARKIAAARGAQSVSKEDMLQSATAIDDARFKTPERPKEKFTIQPLPPAPAAPRAVGNKATVTIPATRNKVEVQDELLDLADVKFAEGELQNRDRSRPQTQQFLRRFTSEFDPEGLGEDRSTDRGAPIINKDNVILSGNGRTMGLEEIYEKHPEQAEKYRQFLRDNGWNIEGIERPFLARRLLSEVDEREFVTGSNEADIAALSPPEQAAQDAQDILKPAVLAKYNGGDLKAAKNDAFVSAFLAEMSPQQRENAMDDKGNISAQALKRIENALLYKAYGQAGRASDIFISKAMERSDDDTKTLTNALVDVAKDWIKFQQAVKNGEVDKKYDITGKLMETVGTVSDIKASGTKLSDALRSPDMVNPMDPFVRDILLSFYNDNLTRMLSKKAIAEKLYAFTEVAANQQPEPDMFGKAQTPSARDIWKRVDAGEGAPQVRMFAPPTPANKGAPSKPALPSFWQQMFDDAEKIPSLSLEIKKLTKLHDEGKIDDEDFAREVKDIQWFVGEMRDAKRLRDADEPRLRGADRIREVVLAAKRRGDITEDAADLAEWFALRNPHLIDSLGISVIKESKKVRSPFYTPFDRIMHLVKGASGETSAVHEIMHHLERMMPEPIRKAIKASWAKELDKVEAERYAGRNRNDDLFFKALRAFHAGEKVKINGENLSPSDAFDFAKDLLSSGKVNGRFYQYVNPSEFWAVNATEIMKGRYDVQGSLLGRLRNWLRELSAKIKGVFKMDPNAPIIKALDSLAKGDGKFVSNRMLEEKLGKFGEGPSEVTSLDEKRTEKDLNELDKLIDSLSDAMDKEQFAIPQMSSKLKTALGNALQSLYDISDDAAPKFDRKIDRIETKILNLKAISQASLKPANQNDQGPVSKGRKSETEYEKAEREAIEAEDAFIKFAFNPEDERPIMDRRSKAYKEWAKEADRLEKINDEAKSRFEKAIAKRDQAALNAISKGSPAEMKKAIAEAQKPDNKIMDERADIQKKNRGCD
jgi:hypothetical protein